MTHWIAIVNPGEVLANLTVDELHVLLTTPEIAGFDVRVSLTGAAADTVRFCAAVRDAGKRLRLHSWVGKRHKGRAAVTAAIGTLQGRQAAARVYELGAESFGANAERDVWRGRRRSFWSHKRRAFKGAVPFLLAFADAYHDAEVGQLHYLGFADVAWHYVDVPDWAEARDRFQRVMVMAYQTRVARLRKTISRARARWPEHPMTVFPSVGRIDKIGRVIGNAKAWLTLITQRYGAFDEACWYVGNGAWKQLIHGHRRHAALVDLIPVIEDAAADGYRMAA